MNMDEKEIARQLRGPTPPATKNEEKPRKVKSLVPSI
jgi:hypothetical protein